ncbi:DODA-type extradiol aromatic ring-opening family dioxygenase [Motilimonas eburnea]|uniref:DODA-type extradiol aromatic ring-opening family dioxygenase n=1 Tax=Motilimonas eburnea TaxID=1737488 RepID=UPI001E342353|nr:class III extradiol ring-cleavage dioxygenase [Motilimonas eburnea]MCE2572794.1 dioxygenase [Motilimonas eburnea]
MNDATVIFLSHGGGPMPLLGDPSHQAMVATLNTIAKQMVKPSAILVISAHWEADPVMVTSSAAPDLIYDYGGFPSAAYDIRYPCKGEPALAAHVLTALHNHGIEAKENVNRGYDHGLFVPLKIMYPEADIPCVQLSLSSSLDASFHLLLGKALRQIQWNDLLVVGSGFSFHNMQAFFAPSQQMKLHNQAFESWLGSTLCTQDMSEQVREQNLAHWQQVPGARACHPREEHLLPLHVCYGLAGRACDQDYSVEILGYQASMFVWFGKNIESFSNLE